MNGKPEDDDEGKSTEREKGAPDWEPTTEN